MKTAIRLALTITALGTLAFLAFNQNSSAAPAPAPQITSISSISTAQFLTGMAQGARYGPGVMDASAPLAGPGPWNILPLQTGSSLSATITLQNIGDRTAELYYGTSGAVVLQVAGGQCQSAFVGLGATTGSLALRFVGGGTEGKAVWVGR